MMYIMSSIRTSVQTNDRIELATDITCTRGAHVRVWVHSGWKRDDPQVPETEVEGFSLGRPSSSLVGKTIGRVQAPKLSKDLQVPEFLGRSLLSFD